MYDATLTQVGVFALMCIERFSNGCHKTETKLITLSNHSGNKMQSEPIIN